MRITKPSYYDHFRCIASLCPDSCCKEWDVDVDEETTKLYYSLPGSLGDRLRQVLRPNSNGGSCMTITDGRCPMWRQDGLCRIQAELGHDALCKTCRDFPRITHDYGDFLEMGLELSCPEAARLILTSPPLPPVTREVPGDEAHEYDEYAMAVLLQTRETALRFLADPGLSPREALAVLLLYGYQAQDALDGGDVLPLDALASLHTARRFAADGKEADLRRFFLGLEILTPGWKKRLENPDAASWSAAHLTLARYFVERYWLQAVSDYDLVSRVKLAVASCILIRLLGADVIGTAQLYSKEIENSTENVEAILDGAYTHPALTDQNLLGLLLN